MGDRRNPFGLVESGKSTRKRDEKIWTNHLDRLNRKFEELRAQGDTAKASQVMLRIQATQQALEAKRQYDEEFSAAKSGAERRAAKARYRQSVKGAASQAIRALGDDKSARKLESKADKAGTKLDKREEKIAEREQRQELREPLTPDKVDEKLGEFQTFQPSDEMTQQMEGLAGQTDLMQQFARDMQGLEAPQFDFTQADQTRQEQMATMDLLRQRALGTALSPAELQMQSALERQQAQALGSAASVPGASPGLALRQALDAQTQAGQQTSRDAAILRAQEANTAIQNMGQLSGQMRAADAARQKMVTDAALTHQKQVQDLAQKYIAMGLDVQTAHMAAQERIDKLKFASEEADYNRRLGLIQTAQQRELDRKKHNKERRQQNIWGWTGVAGGAVNTALGAFTNMGGGDDKTTDSAALSSGGGTDFAANLREGHGG